MTRHFDRIGAESAARARAYMTGIDHVVSPGFEAKRLAGPQWLSLSALEYRRMNVIPAVTRYDALGRQTENGHIVWGN